MGRRARPDATPGRGRLTLATSWGSLEVWAERGRIVACRLPQAREGPREPLRLGPVRRATTDKRTEKLLKKAERFVRRVLAGRCARVPPLALPPAAAFTRRVWRALRRIPRGRTVSYGALAGQAGRPGAARAVGRACAANPLPLFVPCHRVVRSDGGLGGFRSGTAWKKWLLERESRAARRARASRRAPTES